MSSTEKIPLTEKKNKKEEPEDTSSRAFSSHFATVCTCIGSAVGTGNVWRFSRIVAQSSGPGGGLCFLLVWLAFLFLWSIPMLLIEYAMGRYTKKGIIVSFLQILGPKSTWCAAWVAFVTFAITCYYAVILGWCIYYTFYTIIYPLPVDYAEASEAFYNMANTWWAVLTQFIALLVSGLILLKNVSTIEKASMILSPLLLITLLFICVWSVTREKATVGIKFLFSPDWETMNDAKTWMNAASQNAFDTAAGEGNFIAYAAYMTRESPAVKYAVGIPAFNNMVSLICGMSTFATAFGSILHENPNTTNAEILQILQTSGPGSTGITFIWMPVLFSSFGTFGRVVGALFFFCLTCAGLSSAMSFMETCMRSLEDLGLKRKIGLPILITAAFLLGLPSALSLEFLDSQDFTWGYALLTTGLALQACVILYGTYKYRTVLINDYGLGDWYVPKVWEWLIKYVAPFEAVGLLIWWVVDNILYGEGKDKKWYEIGAETLMTVLVQWFIVIIVFILINVLLVTLKPKWWTNILDHVPSLGAKALDESTSDQVPAADYSGSQGSSQPTTVTDKIDANGHAGVANTSFSVSDSDKP